MSSSLRSLTAGNLRAEMARHRKTSLDLANVLNVSQSSASRRMTGEKSLDLDEVEVIAEWLNIPVSPIFASGRAASEILARAESGSQAEALATAS